MAALRWHYDARPKNFYHAKPQRHKEEEEDHLISLSLRLRGFA
jgi:hypothetical protein